MSIFNSKNSQAHRDATALEIIRDVMRPIDGFCSGIGTGGTITGIGEVLKEYNPQIEIWAVEPEHAAILAGGNIGTHIQMGIGGNHINTKILRQKFDCCSCVPTTLNLIQENQRITWDQHKIAAI